MSNLDTTSKRRSSCQVLQPWQLTPPDPDGTIGSADWHQIAYTYSGISSFSAFVYTVTTNLLFNQDILRTADLNQTVTTNLTFSEIASGAPLSASISSNLGLTHSLINNRTLSKTVTTNLDFKDKANRYLTVIDVSLTDNLHLFDTIGGDNADQTLSVSDSLSLGQSVRRNLDLVALSDTIIFTQSVVASYNFAHTISFTQSLTYDQTTGVTSTLNLTQGILATVDRNITLTSSLTLGQSLFGYSPEHPPSICAYDPNISISNSNMPSTVGSYTKEPNVTLTYPYDTPSLTLVLRSPELENAERDSYNRIIRETRGGTQKIYRDTVWPKNKRLSYEIIFNKNQAIEDFLDFVESSVGQEVGLLDYLNRQWKGILIPPDDLVTYVGRSNRKIAFDFEGELV